ncbi:HAD-like domain-containing protein [Thelonectria olida]|uniref:HAD-like domain-containing protein n=1 Tax=Thelonectria olida TaxID=1576542 RepID=A0A9P8W8R3_9HYPO|nr:HAD-like domain-containing protein [Thelonectria olida]
MPQVLLPNSSNSEMAYQAGSQPRHREQDFSGFLIDLDGTIIDSTAAVVKHWADVGKEIGVDSATILEMSHGRRSLDTLQLVAPEKATWEYVQKIESAIPKNHGHLATEIPGASSLLRSLASCSAPWAIVTSSTAPLAKGWLERFSLPCPKPERLVTAESVKVGKPDPACYLLGCSSIGSTNGALEMLVIEDSPAGIRAGKAANCRVLALLTSHTYEQIAASGPDWIVKDLECVRILALGGQKFRVEICNIV